MLSCILLPTRLMFADGLYADVQYTGLTALYNASRGQQWFMSSGWRNATLGVCGWYGVTCDRFSGNVTGLSLPGNNLEGDISAATAISNVVSLQEVDLSDNQLSGSVPLGLGMMPALEVLDLSGNELSWFPPAWGSNALELRYLSLQSNKISG